MNKIILFSEGQGDDYNCLFVMKSKDNSIPEIKFGDELYAFYKQTVVDTVFGKTGKYYKLADGRFVTPQEHLKMFKYYFSKKFNLEPLDVMEFNSNDSNWEWTTNG